MKPLKIIYYVSLGIIALLALLLVFSTFPIPGNYKLFVVQSGSMNPAIKMGSIVVVKPVAEYQKAEIITFTDDKNPKNQITHRISEVKKADERVSFVTKGDANNAPDSSEISQTDVIGKVLFTVPFIGFGVAATRQPIGFMLLIILPATLIIYDEIRKIKDEVVKMRSKKALFFLLAFSVSLMTFNFTKAYLADTETSTGNTFQVTTWGIWKQTNKGDFEAGTLSNVDTTTSSGDVMLTGAYPIEGNTVGLWHLNEGSGTMTDDSSPNNNDGTLKGDTKWVSGKYSQGLEFDGNGDYVEVPDKDILTPNSQITLEAWIFPKNLTGEHMIISKYNHTTNDRSYNMRLVNDKLRFELSSDGSWQDYQLDSSTSLSLNTWTHVVAVSDGTTMKLYINGSEDSNTHLAPSSLYNNTENLRIGSYLPSDLRTFDGIIDEVRISNTAKTSFPIDYFSPGTLESQVFDGGETRDWDYLEWDETLTGDPGDNDITFEVSTSTNGTDWSAWSAPLSDSPIDLTPLPDTRYIKWRANLTTNDNSKTPTLKEVRIRHFAAP